MRRWGGEEVRKWGGEKVWMWEFQNGYCRDRSRHVLTVTILKFYFKATLSCRYCTYRKFKWDQKIFWYYSIREKLSQFAWGRRPFRPFCYFVIGFFSLTKVMGYWTPRQKSHYNFFLFQNNYWLCNFEYVPWLIILITDYWLLITDYWLLITDYWLLITDYWLPFHI